MTNSSKDEDKRLTRGALESGGRVFLRLPVFGDRKEYQELRRDSAEFHQPWEPSPPPGVDPFLDEAFARYLNDSDTPRRRRMLLCRLEDGAILGGIHINEIVRGVFFSA